MTEAALTDAASRPDGVAYLCERSVTVGTNYYLHYAECACCKRRDELHIGKSLVMFRGYVRDPDWPDDPEPTPFGEIKSWADWKAVLLSEGVSVWDEYGRAEEVAAFIEAVEHTDPDARSRQYLAVVDRHYRDGMTGVVTPGGEWLDPEGFSFYAGEFS